MPEHCPNPPLVSFPLRGGSWELFKDNPSFKSNLNNLSVAKEDLISWELILRDVDRAVEMATFTRNQIMSQSATAMLAQANQMPKNVLQLLN